MKKCVAIAAAAALSLAALPLAACNQKDAGNASVYHISATFDETDGVLYGNCRFNFFNNTDNRIASLEFNLWGNAYREGAAFAPVSEAYFSKAYYAGKSYGYMSVEKVENCASWEIGGEDENILFVNLEEPVFPEERAEVDIEFSLKLAKVNHRTGITETGVNLGNFYPVLCAYGREGFLKAPYYSCGDPFVSDCADYEVNLTYPEKYIAATSGREVGKSTADGKTTASYCLKSARDFAAVLSENFKVATEQIRGCTISYYYSGEDLSGARLDAAKQSFEYFCDTFGAYPYDTLSVVSVPISMSGMEYPALVLTSDTLKEDDGVYTTVHEVAHQWWYAAVGSDQINHAWQDEGLAEYSCLCFFETHPEYGFTRTGILGGAIKSYRAYYSVYNQIFGKADTTMNRSLKDFASDYEYVNVAYNKSLLAFESVRSAMGDKKFFEALKEYYADNLFKIASPEELIASFSSRHDVEGLIDGYISGKVVI